MLFASWSLCGSFSSSCSLPYSPTSSYVIFFRCIVSLGLIETWRDACPAVLRWVPWRLLFCCDLLFATITDSVCLGLLLHGWHAGDVVSIGACISLVLDVWCTSLWQCRILSISVVMCTTVPTDPGFTALLLMLTSYRPVFGKRTVEAAVAKKPAAATAHPSRWTHTLCKATECLDASDAKPRLSQFRTYCPKAYEEQHSA